MNGVNGGGIKGDISDGCCESRIGGGDDER